jgi:NTP pyrophosphatase (non-canonical NTP hydrolase)
MELDHYQTLASKTGLQGERTQEYRLMYLTLGLAGETGEVVEKIKKLVRNDAGVLSEEKKHLITHELGDVLWYLSQLAGEIGVSLNTVGEANIQKLADRAARGAIKSEGDTR